MTKIWQGLNQMIYYLSVINTKLYRNLIKNRELKPMVKIPYLNTGTENSQEAKVKGTSNPCIWSTYGTKT